MQIRSKILVSAFVAMAATIASGEARAADPAAVLETYADIAEAGYEDSLTTARALEGAIAALLAEPTEATLQDAREAWRAARVPYQQTEAFRFGNPTVDAWEGRVNAWPLDEGLIDYIAADSAMDDENPFAGANVIANRAFEAGGQSIDAQEITPELIASLHEIGGVDANVASGYHAIEFLLWGQDLNGTGPGAGARPASNFSPDPATCTGGNCARRADYLRSASALLVADLEEAVANWSAGGQGRADVTADPRKGVEMALTGLGVLSFSELASDRMKLGLVLHDPEEEHDCFSDNTHESLYYDGIGIRNVYTGSYRRIDGSLVSGPALHDLLEATDPALARALTADIERSVAALGAIRAAAQAGMAYDQMLAIGNGEGGALIQNAIDDLAAQTRNIERAVALAPAMGAPGE